MIVVCQIDRAYSLGDGDEIFVSDRSILLKAGSTTQRVIAVYESPERASEVFREVMGQSGRILRFPEE